MTLISKKRIDVLLVEKNLVSSREKAKELIKNNLVKVNGQLISKCSKEVDINSSIEIIDNFRYVSRAGYKLEKALIEFNINVEGKICLDIGSSVGGFVDCLLQHNAKKIYAIEIAKDILDKKIKLDKRVVDLGGVNVRDDFKLNEKIDFVSIDATFISLIEILPLLNKYLNNNFIIVALFKPPFETNLNFAKKVDNKIFLNEILNKTIVDINNLNFNVKNYIKSPILGKVANQEEYLLYITN